MRGIQVTDGDGRVEFFTIYPGAYVGRVQHLHVKIHLGPTTVLTTQLYLPDDLNALVPTQAPYDQFAPPNTTNASDSFFLPENVMAVVPDGDGYVASIRIDVVE
jgi:protocatechuate 3,4-dioxygenase beta subunit